MLLDPRIVEIDREEPPGVAGTPGGRRIVGDCTNLILFLLPLVVARPSGLCAVRGPPLGPLLGSRPVNRAKLSMWIEFQAESRRKSDRNGPKVEWQFSKALKMTVYSYTQSYESNFVLQTGQ